MESEPKTVKVNFPWATLELSPDPCFTDPFFERGNFDLISDLEWPEDAVFLDVGAHQGIWSTFLAQLTERGTVHTYEPHPDNQTILQRNLNSPRFERVFISFCSQSIGQVAAFALGSEDGTAKLRCFNNSTAGTGMHQLLQGQEPDYEVEVPVRKLDSLDFSRVDFIKIDVEHWEWEVVQGARETILRDRPRMLVECHNVQSVIRLTGFCEENRLPYRFTWAGVPAIGWQGRYLWVDPTRKDR